MFLSFYSEIGGVKIYYIDNPIQIFCINKIIKFQFLEFFDDLKKNDFQFPLFILSCTFCTF